MNSQSQISFLDGTFSLIHIPLSLYPVFLQPILQVLLPNGEFDSGKEIEGLSIDNKHGFLNVSITPVECSVVCHDNWAKKVFEPVIRRLSRDASKTVTISKDSYLILSVISAGMNAGTGVMELTSPLALAGIPIFFITTYYSDFILVPTKDRQTVVQALLSRGFEFSEDESAFVSPTVHVRGGSVSSQAPSTPLPTNVTELQTRTFELLRKRDVIPFIEEGLTVVLCSGKDPEQEQMNHFSRRPVPTRRATGNGINGGHARRSWLDNVDTKLYTSLISVLVLQPRFLSMTLAQEDPPSLPIGQDPAQRLWGLPGGGCGRGPRPDLLRSGEPAHRCHRYRFRGRRPARGRDAHDRDGDGEQLSYLSTARAGAVILSSEQSLKALEVMRPLLNKE
ncbi:hypothetical protein PG994_009172 [Apiospora phragmitis]|uniref:CASTOR ACT domain-containing protein n=1 Tax=Apiospora phragmitis TaxID=2905665 RepID=A0ABR1UII1_9PEZI